MSSSLQEIDPSPFKPQEKPNLGPGPNKDKWQRAINVLYECQKYSTIPFSLFSVLHLSAVVLSPNTEIGNQLLVIGRTIYQAPGFEPVLIASVTTHVLSGIFLRITRKIRNKKYYGKSSHKPKDSDSGVILKPDDKKDSSYGLGGISSLLGLGAKRSFVSRKWGISPISFSGFVLVPMLFYHVLHQRFVPLFVDGDSSMITLEFIASAIAENPFKVVPGLVALVWLASYHMVSGARRYLKLYGIRSSRVAYFIINGLSACAAVSLYKISKLPLPMGFTRDTFQKYLTFLP